MRRAASALLRPYNPNLDVKPFEVLSCVDYGDVAIVPGYIERSYAAIEQTVAPVVDAGVIPILIGGDHACTLPHLRATRSLGPVAVIDFDFHTDAWDSYFGEKYNHESTHWPTNHVPMRLPGLERAGCDEPPLQVKVNGVPPPANGSPLMRRTRTASPFGIKVEQYSRRNSPC